VGLLRRIRKKFDDHKPEFSRTDTSGYKPSLDPRIPRLIRPLPKEVQALAIKHGLNPVMRNELKKLVERMEDSCRPATLKIIEGHVYMTRENIVPFAQVATKILAKAQKLPKEKRKYIIGEARTWLVDSQRNFSAQQREGILDSYINLVQDQPSFNVRIEKDWLFRDGTKHVGPFYFFSTKSGTDFGMLRTREFAPPETPVPYAMFGSLQGLPGTDIRAVNKELGPNNFWDTAIVEHFIKSHRPAVRARVRLAQYMDTAGWVDKVEEGGRKYREHYFVVKGGPNHRVPIRKQYFNVREKYCQRTGRLGNARGDIPFEYFPVKLSKKNVRRLLGTGNVR
jgi:hypothetical protein